MRVSSPSATWKQCDGGTTEAPTQHKEERGQETQLSPRSIRPASPPFHTADFEFQEEQLESGAGRDGRGNLGTELVGGWCRDRARQGIVGDDGRVHLHSGFGGRHETRPLKPAKLSQTHL